MWIPSAVWLSTATGERPEIISGLFLLHFLLILMAVLQMQQKYTLIYVIVFILKLVLTNDFKFVRGKEQLHD